MEKPLSFEQQYKKSKRNITEIELKLSTLSKLLSNPNNSTLNPEVELRGFHELIREGNALVDSLEDTLNELEVKDSKSLLTVRRQRSKLEEFSKQGNKLESKISSLHQRDELFSGAKSLSTRDRIAGKEDVDEAEYFLGERTHIENSYAMTDATLNQAYAVRDELNEQGRSLANSTSRVSSLSRTFSGMHGLLNRISFRRRRDTLILGAITAIGIFLLFLTAWH